MGTGRHLQVFPVTLILRGSCCDSVIDPQRVVHRAAGQRRRGWLGDSTGSKAKWLPLALDFWGSAWLQS
jgi:hypothetical protein